MFCNSDCGDGSDEPKHLASCTVELENCANKGTFSLTHQYINTFYNTTGYMFRLITAIFGPML